MRLQLITPVPAVAADLTDTARTIAGLACPYGVVGRTSAGPVTIRAGAVNIPTDLRRVKLFREHGRTAPVGYALTATSGPTGLSMTFRAAATPDGDTALLEASEGVRDALSVELDNVELDAAGTVTRADLTAVALTSIPAFADARIVASDTPEPPAAPAPAPATDPDADDNVDDDDDDEQDTDMPAPAPAPAPGPGTVTGSAVAPGLGRTRRPRNRRGMTLEAAMNHVVTMVGESTDANTINAALADIVPAADTSDGAFIRPQWVDELWTPIDQRRPYSNSVTPGNLTGMKVHGWKWGTRPVVGPYAGNKTPIPTGPVSFGPAEATAVRHAGGWDVDNIFIYLGDASLLTAILNAAAMDYADKLEASISAAIVDEATPAAAPDLVTGLTTAASTLAGAGSRPSFVALANDLWGEFLNLPAAEAPWWLSQAASTVNLTDGTSAAADLRVFVDPTLTDGHILAGDRRAVTHYTPRGNPFRVQAVNIPNGGVDIGVFGFAANLVNDSRGIVDVTVGP